MSFATIIFEGSLGDQFGQLVGLLTFCRETRRKPIFDQSLCHLPPDSENLRIQFPELARHVPNAKVDQFVYLEKADLWKAPQDQDVVLRKGFSGELSLSERTIQELKMILGPVKPICGTLVIESGSESDSLISNSLVPNSFARLPKVTAPYGRKGFDLIRGCREYVIVKSTIGWWGAVLNDYSQKRVHLASDSLKWFPEWTLFPEYQLQRLLKEETTELKVGESERMEKLLEICEKSCIGVGREVRELCHSVLGPKSLHMIDLSQTLLMVVSRTEREAEMTQRFKRFGLGVKFIPAASGTQPIECCTYAHLQALKYGLSQGKPFAVFEDDVAFQPEFQTRFVLPRPCDAFYFGSSPFGATEWWILGMRNNIRVTEDALFWLRCYNMYSAHAILYLNMHWVEKLIQWIEMSLKMCIPHDTALARLQNESNVLTARRPWVVQDVCFKAENIATYEAMEKFL